ncbi:metallophosphoesterase [Rhodoferax aquaticus]|uniref:Metallophosphoesterase n=1 Tax=Rhodoferax aquaticus TaxID=2527691 RepID=A0A515EUW4_9BURK|nr:metallophosphoesterase [Rhodoferax aquaticus]QDL56477.1 metallophosphoesterase [Rhodoferax aquaticus]
MKIQLLSDLHLETHPQWRATPAPDADLLVLAGDVGSYQTGSQLQDADFGLGQFSKQAGWPTPVLYIPGNHEYDGLDFDATHQRLQDTCERLGITWLERQTVLGTWHDQQGRPVRILGTTLWSDFDALSTPAAAAPSPHGINPLAHQLKAREKAYRAANYYLKKAATTRHGAPFLAEEMRQQALVCQAWLQKALLTPFEGSTLVVTHFAPSLRSADPRYGLVPGTAGFCNALDHLLPHATMWLHGHLHAPSNYQYHGCHVIANPLGYARKSEQDHFLPNHTISL